MQWRRRIRLCVLAVAIMAAIVYGFWPKPVSVDAVDVTRGPLTVTIEEEGKTRVIDRYVVSAPVAGFARRIELDVGDPVNCRDVLVNLEPQPSRFLDPRTKAEAEARVAAARAALSAAQEDERAALATADYAAAELGRIRKLSASGSVSTERLDRAETEAAQADAEHRSSRFAVEVARFELEAMHTALQYSQAKTTQNHVRTIKVRAPVDGRVLRIHHKSEGLVEAGQALIDIGDPRALEVEIDLLSADSVRIRPGTRVLFDRWGGTRPLEGRVRLVEPAGFTKISALGVEEQRVLVIADIVSPMDMWEGLGDGYRVEARFILWQGKDVLQIPAGALFRYKGRWAVFVLEQDKARRRPVEIGHQSGLTAQIVSGLAEGEIVITHPDTSIEDGRVVESLNGGIVE